MNNWSGVSTADANWTLGSGVSVSDGGTGSIGMTSPGPLTSGKTYRAVIDVVTRSAGTIWFGWDSTNTDYGTASAVGRFAKDFVAANTRLYIYSDAFNGTVDNYSVKEVLSATLSSPGVTSILETSVVPQVTVTL